MVPDLQNGATVSWDKPSGWTDRVGRKLSCETGACGPREEQRWSMLSLRCHRNTDLWNQKKIEKQTEPYSSTRVDPTQPTPNSHLIEGVPLQFPHTFLLEVPMSRCVGTHVSPVSNTSGPSLSKRSTHRSTSRRCSGTTREPLGNHWGATTWQASTFTVPSGCLCVCVCAGICDATVASCFCDGKFKRIFAPKGSNYRVQPVQPGRTLGDHCMLKTVSHPQRGQASETNTS